MNPVDLVAVEALAEARAGGVLGRGDAHVMAAVVLDEEVSVAALRERDAAQPALAKRRPQRFMPLASVPVIFSAFQTTVATES